MLIKLWDEPRGSPPSRNWIRFDDLEVHFVDMPEECSDVWRYAIHIFCHLFFQLIFPHFEGAPVTFTDLYLIHPYDKKKTVNRIHLTESKSTPLFDGPSIELRVTYLVIYTLAIVQLGDHRKKWHKADKMKRLISFQNKIICRDIKTRREQLFRDLAVFFASHSRCWPLYLVGADHIFLKIRPNSSITLENSKGKRRRSKTTAEGA